MSICLLHLSPCSPSVRLGYYCAFQHCSRQHACHAAPAAGLETHLSVTDVGGLILAVIAFNLAAALTPTKGTFVPDEEELAQRPAGALQVL